LLAQITKKSGLLKQLINFSMHKKLNNSYYICRRTLMKLNSCLTIPSPDWDRHGHPSLKEVEYPDRSVVGDGMCCIILVLSHLQFKIPLSINNSSIDEY